MKHTVLTPEQVQSRLFIGVYPAGLVYADRSLEVAGDYKRLAFLNYSTLKLDVWPDCHPSLADAIRVDAAKMQAQLGKPFHISASGQCVTLGSAL